MLRTFFLAVFFVAVSVNPAGALAGTHSFALESISAVPGPPTPSIIR